MTKLALLSFSVKLKACMRLKTQSTELQSFLVEIWTQATNNAFKTQNSRDYSQSLDWNLTLVDKAWVDQTQPGDGGGGGGVPEESEREREVGWLWLAVRFLQLYAARCSWLNQPPSQIPKIAGPWIMQTNKWTDGWLPVYRILVCKMWHNWNVNGPIMCSDVYTPICTSKVQLVTT